MTTHNESSAARAHLRARRNAEIRTLVVKLNELDLAGPMSLILINVLRAALLGLTNPKEGESE